MSRRSAFTLVELLVVTGIIALLISLILPSLSSARDKAKETACAANLKSIVMAQMNYASQFNDWMAGSPGTTGLEYNLLGQSKSRPDQREANMPGVMTQDWDWAGPLAHYGMGYSLSDNRAVRSRQVREGVFLCPSIAWEAAPKRGWDENDEVSSDGPWDAFPEWDYLPMTSYSSFVGFMYFGKQPLNTNITEEGIYYPWDPFRHVFTPESYVPKLSKISAASRKVFLADGARSVWDGRYNGYSSAAKPSGAQIPGGQMVYEPEDDRKPPHYKVNYSSYHGGSFSDPSPVKWPSRAYPVPESDLHDYAYRHRVAEAGAIQSAFFDGHVAKLTSRASQSQVDYWFPSGTYIGEEAALRMSARQQITRDQRWADSPPIEPDPTIGVYVR